VRKQAESGELITGQTKKRPQKRKKLFWIGGIVAVAISLIVGGLYLGADKKEAIESIAVRPFANLSGDPDQDYFVDGMTEELISELAKIGALQVTSRTSVIRYKDTDKSLPEIARELGVDAIVEGTVLRDGNQVRITVQLIHASTDRHLWTDRYDRELTNILGLHSDVAQAIAQEVQATLTPQEQGRLTGTRPVNPDAYELYLRGRHEFFKYKHQAFEKAVEYFQQAIEIDSNYAEAYAMLGACYVYFGWSRSMPLEEARSRAAPPLRKAFEIDDMISEAYYALAMIKFYFDWDWAAAETEFKRAIELNPSNGETHGQYAWCLMAMGRFDEAIAEAERGLQLDPVLPLANFGLAQVYYCARQYDLAIAQYQQLAELDPNDYGPEWFTADVFAQIGRYEDAIEARKNALRLMKIPPAELAADIAALDSAYSESGPEGYWRWHLHFKYWWRDHPAADAVIYAQIGDKERAFALLEQGYEEHSPEIHLLKAKPSFDPLRDDPRYHDLLRRMNFPE
jgi:TolB-like protein/Tfp pilus assembly protein PilF